MDFRTPDFITDALRRRLDHPILGYPSTGEDYFRIVSDWVYGLHGWRVAPECFRYVPGIVRGLGFALRCLLSPGDKVIIQQPVYHPFREVPEACGFEVVNNPLKPVYDSDGFLRTYEMDLEAFEAMIDGRTKAMILCNPHNPGGTSWSEDELRRLADLCAKHHVIIVSDEIHADLTLSGHKHVMMASVSDTARDITVTMMAPTKAFNLPGVVASHTIIFNDSLRRRFFSYLDGNDLGLGNVFAYDCVCACYSAEGEEWLNEMLGYVQENISYVLSFLSQHCPKITAIRPEASFLVFLDNHKLGLESQKEIVDFYINDARLFLNDGEMFGAPGRGYMRMNVAQPRCVIEKAMNQLAEAYRKRGFDK